MILVGSLGFSATRASSLARFAVAGLTPALLTVSQIMSTHEKADSTRRCSQAVPHPSTNRALSRLTSEVERDPVYSTRYGRQRKTISAQLPDMVTRNEQGVPRLFRGRPAPGPTTSSQEAQIIE